MKRRPLIHHIISASSRILVVIKVMEVTVVVICGVSNALVRQIVMTGVLIHLLETYLLEQRIMIKCAT